MRPAALRAPFDDAASPRRPFYLPSTAAMAMIVEPAPAKINLALHVRSRGVDGYHAIETLFAFARDGDLVTIEPTDTWSFHITGPFAADLTGPHPAPSAPSPPGKGKRPVVVGDTKVEGEWHDNLVTRAADAFCQAFPDTPPQAITLDKRLPIASGIGGGSADAAATLRALARINGITPDDARLLAIAASLGADLPACLLGQTSLGTGKGDELTPIDGLPGTPLLLVNPGVAVPTGAVFRGWDGIDRGPLGDGPLLARARAGRNDLATSARAIAPVIAEVEAMLTTAPGVLLTRMSGSGATCFALFESEAQRDRTVDEATARRWWTLATTLA